MTASAQSPLEPTAADPRDEPAPEESEAHASRMASRVPPRLDLAVLETAMIAATLALFAGVLL